MSRCGHTPTHIYMYKEEMGVEPYKEYKYFISIKFNVLVNIVLIFLKSEVSRKLVGIALWKTGKNSYCFLST